jgi:hypothetical protein
VVQSVAIVTWYVCRRKRRDLPLAKEDEVTCQVWLILAVCPEGAGTDSEPAVNHCPDVGTAHKAGERLKETVAEVLAGRLEGMVWKTTDDLSEDQVAGLLAGLPEMVKTLGEKPLDIPGDPAPVVSLGADVSATLLLKSALEPLESTVDMLEVVGIVLGLATGMHPLVITCVKHLAYDELGDVLTHAFEQIMSPAYVQVLDTQPLTLHRPEMEPLSAGKSSAAPGGPSNGTAGKSMAHWSLDSGHVALCGLAESAAMSARLRNRTAAVDHESAKRPSISAITGILHRENSGAVNGEAAVKVSLERAKELRAALDRHGFGATARQDDADLPATGLLRSREDPASVTKAINTVSNPSAVS